MNFPNSQTGSVWIDCILNLILASQILNHSVPNHPILLKHQGGPSFFPFHGLHCSDSNRIVYCYKQALEYLHTDSTEVELTCMSLK